MNTVYKSFAANYRIVCEPNPSFNKAKVTGAIDIVNFIRQLYNQAQDIEVIESFYILLLNQANNITGWVKLSSGGLTGTVADPRLIAKYAVEQLATSVAIAHNHPSGNLKPSQGDEQVTQRIKQGLQFLDIRLLDHVILTADSHYSFAEEGML